MSDNSNEISKTALIPLWARAKALNIIDQNKVEWQLANELLEKIDLDSSPLDRLNTLTQKTTILDIAIRSILINKILDDLSPNQTIINIGAGFDLKSQLYRDKFVCWINFDLESIISMRKRHFLAENNLVMNILDYNVLTNFEIKNPVFIFEGIFMYLKVADCQAIVQFMVQTYPTSKFIIEIGGSWIKYTNHPAFAKMKTNVNYLWGLNNKYEFAKLFRMLKIDEYYYVLDEHKEIWGKYSLLFKYLPITKSKFGSQIILAKA